MLKRIGFSLLAASVLTLGFFSAWVGSTTGTTPAATTCGPASSGSTVGSVSTVFSQTAQVGTGAAYSGLTLRAADTICTKTSGRVKYKLTKTKTHVCDSGTPPAASKVVIYPDTKAILSLSSGRVLCAAGTGSQVTYTTPGVKLKTNDPLFGLFVAPKSTTIRVVLGFFDTSGKNRRGVIVGPDQQVTVPAGGNPGPVVAIELSDTDRATLADLQTLLPPFSFGRPDAGSSEVLARIYSRRLIRVGFDAVKNPRATSFVKRYFLELARFWRVKATIRGVSRAEAPAALASGDIDVAVIAGTPTAALDVFPFFAQGKTVWRIWLQQDADWNAGLRTYVLATLNSGRYGVSYRASFRDEPPYGPLESLLFP